MSIKQCNKNYIIRVRSNGELQCTRYLQYEIIVINKECLHWLWEQCNNYLNSIMYNVCLDQQIIRDG